MSETEILYSRLLAISRRELDDRTISPGEAELLAGLVGALPAEGGEVVDDDGVASTTGDCSSRLQDSELDALKVRVGVLEGALRDADDFICDELPCKCPEPHFVNLCRRCSQSERIRAVLAGGEAAPGCDCHRFENQVCDVCQRIDPGNPAPDAGGEAVGQGEEES